MSGAADAGSFDMLPEVYDRFKQLTGGPLRDRLAALLPERSPGRVIDLGCGTGQHAELFAGHYREVVAVDASAPMLAFARQHRASPNITYQRRLIGDVHAENDGQFDLVFSAYTLHHLGDPAREFERCRELLAPGGQVIVVDVVADPGLLSSDGHLPRWYYLEEAWLGYQRDLAAGRDPGEAEELYRLKLHPGWLAHQAGDTLRTGAQLAECFLGVFPGGTVTELYRARMLRNVEAA